MLKKIDPIILKQILLLLCIVLVGGIIFFSLINFFADFLGALIIYVLFRPVTKYLIEKRKWKRGLTSLFIMLITIILLVVPLTLLFNMFIPKLQHLFSDSSVITQTFQTLDNRVYELTGQRFMNPENLKSMQSGAANYIKEFLSQSISILGDIGIMLLFLYYMLSNTGKLETFVMKLLPVGQADLSKFTEELKAQTFSNVLGAPVLATLQGLVAALGYWIFGINEPLFWGVITGFFSFIPMVGGALIWLPSAILLYTTGHEYHALALLVYGILVISMIDNVLRFVLQKKFADVHPLITVMGVILGIKLFGLPGIIFGPLLISYFLLLANIYKEQFINQHIEVNTTDTPN
jgi:predicted PurR-regulated permease PerM